MLEMRLTSGGLTGTETEDASMASSSSFSHDSSFNWRCCSASHDSRLNEMKSSMNKAELRGGDSAVTS